MPIASARIATRSLEPAASSRSSAISRRSSEPFSIGRSLSSRDSLLARQRHHLYAVKSKRETSKDREVSVKLDALQAANAQRREPVMVLEVAEGSFNGCASAVEVAEPL